MYGVSFKLRVFTVVVRLSVVGHHSTSRDTTVWTLWVPPAKPHDEPRACRIDRLFAFLAREVCSTRVVCGLWLSIARYRYRVELSKGTPHVQAVIQMTRFAGHTIAISGIVLSMCFFGICIFPLQSIQTMGIGCGVVVLTTLIANQTLLPVILLSFPRFFEQSATSACYEAVARVVSTICCFCCARKQRTPSTRDFAKLRCARATAWAWVQA